MVNDPGGERGYFAGMTKAQAAAKREELFKIIEDLGCEKVLTMKMCSPVGCYP